MAGHLGTLRNRRRQLMMMTPDRTRLTQLEGLEKEEYFRSIDLDLTKLVVFCLELYQTQSLLRFSFTLPRSNSRFYVQ
jgi:hypothetical protein